MPGFLAVVLVCAATVAGPDCSRDTALDMVVQPVAHETECALAGQVIATRLSLQAGEWYKIACERRRVSPVSEEYPTPSGAWRAQASADPDPKVLARRRAEFEALFRAANGEPKKPEAIDLVQGPDGKWQEPARLEHKTREP